MRNKSLSLLIGAVLSLSMVACGDDDDDGGGGGSADAAPGVDSSPGQPDAAPDQPDAADDPADAGPPDGMPSTSGQIEIARAAADGAVSLPIDDAYVTYVKAAVGNDAAGLFLQAEQTGPALFVAVDPATLTPTPAAGDLVSLTITEMATNQGRREATMISDLAVTSSGNDLSGLIQDVSSATDLVTALDSYEAELVSFAGTIAADFDAAGVGFGAAAIDTTGITSDPALELRVPESVRDALDLQQGCAVTVTAVPMWRFVDTAQLSANEAAEIAPTCAAPAVTAAVASSPTEVVVSFSRTLDAGTVTGDGSQFTIDGLAVSAAAAAGNQVTLTTGNQTPLTSYTVTVADTITDVLGVSLDATMNTATFAGFSPPPPTALINEVDYDQPGLDNAEFIELHNPGEDPFDLTNLAVVLINGNDSSEYDRIALSGTLPAGGFAVVSFDGTGLPEGVLHFAFGSDRNNVQNGSPDGLAVVNTATEEVLDALSYEGEITAATIDGFAATVSLVEGTAATAADSASTTGSLARLPSGVDTDDADTDWAFTTTLTPGEPNL